MADDETLLREIYGARFAAAGFEVEAFNDGVQLTQRLVNAVPDVILTDVMMPLLGGVELIDLINKLLKDNRDKVTIVAYTNYCTDKLIDDFKARGAKDVLRKVDFSGTDLVEKVMSLMSK